MEDEIAVQKALGTYSPTALRDAVVLPYSNPPNYGGSVMYFDKMPVEKLQQLIDAKLVRESCHQNDGPTTRTILQFADAHPGMLVGGYVKKFTPSELVVTTILYDFEVDDIELLKDFVEVAHEADIFEFRKRLYAWWD